MQKTSKNTEGLVQIIIEENSLSLFKTKIVSSDLILL